MTNKNPIYFTCKNNRSNAAIKSEQKGTRSRRNKWLQKENEFAQDDTETLKEYDDHDLDAFRKIRQKEWYTTGTHNKSNLKGRN
jgi:hypothetical protein